MLNLVHNLLVANITSGNDNDVFTVIVGSMEISELLNTDGADVVAVSLNRLTHHVLSEGVEVSVFEESLFISGVVLLMLIGNLNLELLKLGSVQRNVADSVTKH